MQMARERIRDAAKTRQTAKGLDRAGPVEYGTAGQGHKGEMRP